MFLLSNNKTNTLVNGLCCFILAASILVTRQACAAWFEAKGQAAVIDGDKVRARQEATQEAIRQAMLFSGASIKSVQTLTNGLLSDERLLINASGEVEQIELIDEVWQDGIVTVSVRADIFPQNSACSVAQYTKTLATSVFPVANRQHMQDGQIQALPKEFVTRLQNHFNHFSESVSLNYVAPYTAQWDKASVARQAPVLARQSKTQYVITAQITDLSVERHPPSMLSFWQGEKAKRHFGLSLKLIDGMNGGTLLDKQYHTSSKWNKDRFTPVDVTSMEFWSSEYGKSIMDMAGSIVLDVNDALACQPLTGRVIAAQAELFQVSLGRDHGVKVGDEMFVYKTRQLSDSFGQRFIQYNIYPGKVRVTAAHVDTSTVEPVEGLILGNIQPNDFVAIR